METITKVAWAHIKDGKLLCVRTKGLELFYNVGGKPEADETEEEALIREVKEEVGVDLIPDSIRFLVEFVGEGVDKAAGKMVIFKLFAAQCLGEPHIPSGPHESESDELRWVGLDEKHYLPPLGGQAIDWLVANGYL